MRRIVITGGAGFVGSNLSLELASRHRDWELVALDNLHRRGSELNVSRLTEAGVRFVHGDVREPGDLASLGGFDALIECSAEPSALAGVDGETDFVVQTNLLGAFNCLQAAVRCQAQFIFLSTSRVYPVDHLNALDYREDALRFALSEQQPHPGASGDGINEDFPLGGARTLYGATKLGAELLVTEYADMFGLRTVVNRCGVVAGPWQMGKVDQGVFTHWMLGFYFHRPLTYLGFGGAGKQVRDLLHVDDLVDLVEIQLTDPEGWAGSVYNVGGGSEVSLSLRETTALCQEITGNHVEVSSNPTTRAGDVRIYISDCTALRQRTGWRPTRSARQILGDIYTWIHTYEDSLKPALLRD